MDIMHTMCKVSSRPMVQNLTNLFVFCTMLPQIAIDIQYWLQENNTYMYVKSIVEINFSGVCKTAKRYLT